MNVKYYRKIPFLTLLLLLFLNPFVYWPFSDIYFEVPKVWFVNRVIELIGVLALLFSFTLKKYKRNNLVIYSVFLFYLVAVISGLFGVDLHKSLVGNYYRADGLFTFTHFIILILFLSLYFQKTWLKDIFKAIAYSNLALSLLVCFNFFLALFGKPFFENWDGAIGVNFGNPNFLSGYLLVTLPFAYYFFEKRKSVHKTIFIFQTIAIIFTKAQAGIVGAFLYVSYLIIKKVNVHKIGLVLFMALVVACFAFIGNFLKVYTDGVLVAESRGRIMTKGILALKERPIFGWGWANFDYAFDSVEWPIKIYDDVYVDKAHSTFLEVLVTTGIVGFTVYVALLYIVGKNLYFSRNVYKEYLFAAFVLYVLHSQTNVISISEELFFWTLAGVSTRLKG